MAERQAAAGHGRPADGTGDGDPVPAAAIWRAGISRTNAAAGGRAAAGCAVRTRPEISAGASLQNSVACITSFAHSTSCSQVAAKLLEDDKFAGGVHNKVENERGGRQKFCPEGHAEAAESHSLLRRGGSHLGAVPEHRCGQGAARPAQVGGASGRSAARPAAAAACQPGAAGSAGAQPHEQSRCQIYVFPLL